MSNFLYEKVLKTSEKDVEKLSKSVEESKVINIS